MKELLVLVPKPGTPAGLTIDHGSGVVCDPVNVLSGAWMADERIEVYFEGNRYNAENMQTFGDRVLHAAGRLAQKYPTVARGMFHRGDFDHVGTFSYSDDWKQTSLTITKQALVDRWNA